MRALARRQVFALSRLRAGSSALWDAVDAEAARRARRARSPGPGPGPGPDGPGEPADGGDLGGYWSESEPPAAGAEMPPPPP